MNEEKGIKRYATCEKKKVKATIRSGMYTMHRLVEHCNKIKAQYGLVNYVLILTIPIHG
jgi:hypothetical protein